MEEIRIYATSDVATFVCPKCDKSRKADVGKVLSLESEIKINCKCKCGYHFKAIIERRKFFRKEVELSGVIKTKTDLKRAFVQVIDLSRSGCKLIIDAKSNNFITGDQISLEFKLNDSTQSPVKKQAIIRSSNGKTLGVEFESIDEYDKLGHYLMFT